MDTRKGKWRALYQKIKIFMEETHMKKVLALVLAVMMLATVAFAEVSNPLAPDGTNAAAGILPGKDIEINADGILAAPGGSDYVFVDSNYKKEDGKALKSLNSTNYVITGIKYEDGKALVESVKFDDANDKVIVKLKQDYSMTKPKNLNMTFTLKGKKVGKIKPDNIEVRITKTVNYALNEEALVLDGDDHVVVPDEFLETTIYKVKDSGSNNYGTLEFTTKDPDVDVEVRVYKGDKLYLYNTLKANTDLLKKYADEDADITFLNFPGEPSFNATATVRFYKEEGTYIYTLKDGKLSAVTAPDANAGSAGQTAGKVKWDEDEGCYILKTRSLAKTYVFSDKALPVDAADDTTPGGNVTNPDTGANDVVGIATALAAVALVSAAAVSLKK